MANKSIGATIKLGGEKEYRQAISKINQEQKLFNSEMKKTVAQFSDNEKGLKSLKAQTAIATDSVNNQKEKIATLKGALEDATKKYGENSKEVIRWKTSLNNAEAELVKMEKSLDELESQTKGLGKIKTTFNEWKEKLNEVSEKTEPVTKGLKKIASAAGGVAKISFKALGAGLTAASAGILKIGKDSLEAYADMEQLKDGVKTLFKGASDTVIKNANNAFKTAGMSANEYMENVTSFSASLISSVGGDTAKAAQIADRAIVDMSDNANKMGTDISSIQNAYQGFAKGNYTMLDNLKLGYGGTKEEMKRLIKEASQMTEVQKKLGITVDSSSMSFDNIANAISVVQSNLGIAGATANESATTIQGSVSSMKSAYKNLLAGLSDENADLSQLLNNMVDSIFTVGQNVLPRVGVFLGNLSTSVSDYAPKLISELVSGIVDNLDPLLDAAFTVVDSLSTSLLDENNLEKITTSSVSLIIKLVDGLVNNLDPLIDGAFTVVTSLSDALLEDDNLSKIINAAVEFTTTMTTGLLDHVPELVDAGLQLVAGLVKGLWDNRGKIWDSIKKIGKQLINTALETLGIHSPSTIFKDMGLNLIRGLVNGLEDAKQWVYDKIKNIGHSIIDSAKSVLGIHSPSTEFKKLGDFTGQGFGIGFVDSMKNIRKKMADALPTDLKSEVGVKLRTSAEKAKAIAGELIPSPNRERQGDSKVFNFNISVNIDGRSAENSDLDELAETIGEKLFKQFKKKMEAFA